MSFIKELKSNQIVSQLILSRPMPISMHKIRVSLFMRRFSSNKLEDLVQNSANLNIKLNPWWVTGFIDGEGSFILSIYKDQRQKMGWWIHLSFKIALHIKDKALLERIKNSLGVWRIYNQDTNYVQLFVQSIEELTKVIEHLEKYSLITKKFADYKLLKQAYNLMFKNEHLKEEGLCKFVDIKTSFNLGGFSPKRLFLKPTDHPFGVVGWWRDLVLKIKKSQDLNWLAGFTTGDGCFFHWY